MYIDDIILRELKEVVANVYWYQAPTSGVGTYAVISHVTDTAQSNKDIAATPHVTSMMRIQISIYSSSLSERRVYSDHITHKMKTSREITEAEATWRSAHELSSVAGYTTESKRFYDHQDWRVFYNQTIS